MARPAPRPCGSCPYRKDVPSGVWAEEEYDKLPPYDNDTPEQPFGLFFCHQQDGHLCAGWVGCHDMDHNLAIRLHAGNMSDEDLEALATYESPVPLFESGAQACEHGKRDIDHPDDKTRRTITRLTRKQHTREEREHLRHMTDGLWHDDCKFCLRRRRRGGTGLAPEEERSERTTDRA